MPSFCSLVLEQALSRHGKLVSPIKMIPMSSKSPLLNVVSFRQFVNIVLKDNKDELDLTLKVKDDNFNYVIYASTGVMKCFGCGRMGHLIRACPEKREKSDASVIEQPGGAWEGRSAGTSGGEAGTASPGAAVPASPVARFTRCRCRGARFTQCQLHPVPRCPRCPLHPVPASPGARGAHGARFTQCPLHPVPAVPASPGARGARFTRCRGARFTQCRWRGAGGAVPVAWCLLHLVRVTWPRRTRIRSRQN